MFDRKWFIIKTFQIHKLDSAQETAPVLKSEVWSALCTVAASVVNAACEVYGDVGHLFMVLLRERPQVEVNYSRVDIAGPSILLLHHLTKTFLNQLHGPNGTASDLHFSPVPRRQQFT